MKRRLFLTVSASALLAACVPAGDSNRQLVPRVVSAEATQRGTTFFVSAVAEVDTSWTEILIEGSGSDIRLTGIPSATPSGTTHQVSVGPTAVGSRRPDRQGSREFTIHAANNSQTATAY